MVRHGEYEGLATKLEDPAWKPDFGPASFNPKSGATVVGARDFLVAYNVNLNTTSKRRANSVAFDVRERGRVKRIGDPIVGEIVYDEYGEKVYTPVGGSVAAAIGAFGAALATMVANLSSHKRGWDDRWDEFSDWAERGKACHDELLALIDRGTDAFNGIMAAFGLPRGNDEQAATRDQAIQAATRRAIEVPLRLMEVSLESLDVIEAMAEHGNPAFVSDAGVGALCARSAVVGAYLNAKINTGDLTDQYAAAGYLERGAAMQREAVETEGRILEIVRRKLDD